MVVVVFRARLKPGIEKEMEETDARLAELAAAMSGFVSYRQYASADGEGLAVVEFESHETAAAWLGRSIRNQRKTCTKFPKRLRRRPRTAPRRRAAGLRRGQDVPGSVIVRSAGARL